MDFYRYWRARTDSWITRFAVPLERRALFGLEVSARLARVRQELQILGGVEKSSGGLREGIPRSWEGPVGL